MRDEYRGRRGGPASSWLRDNSRVSGTSIEFVIVAVRSFIGIIIRGICRLRYIPIRVRGSDAYQLQSPAPCDTMPPFNHAAQLVV